MRVLIVEDESVSAKLLESIVAPYGETVRVKNGEEAFDAFCDADEQGRPFDLILLDIKMPEVDGQEALTAIREYEEARGRVQSDGVKIIMTTGCDDLQNHHYSHVAGCNDYLTKPIEPEVLIGKLKHLGLLPAEESSGQ
ncbi:MAG: response regulator [Candidatus Dadabacteria bacterium]|nr:MAG: response regulator [Candidatus Dadabacteria bacterium]